MDKIKLLYYIITIIAIIISIPFNIFFGIFFLLPLFSSHENALIPLIFLIVSLIPLISFIYQFAIKNKSIKFRKKYYIVCLILNLILILVYTLIFLMAIGGRFNPL